jgi:hypothetical protein
MAKNKKDYSFPTIPLNEHSKDEDLTLRIAESIYYEWDRLAIASFAKGADRYSTNRDYSVGKQDTSIHEEQFALEDDPAATWSNLDFKPIPILPRFRRTINEKHGKVNFGITCDAIDPISMSERKLYEAKEAANIQLRQDLDSLGIDSSQLNSGEIDQPKTLEELAMKMEFSYKHNTAIEIEKRIALVFTENRIHEYIFPAIRKDLFECGVAITKDFIDPYSGKVKVRRVRPENFVCSPCVNDDFSDATYFGEIVYYTPGQLKRMMPNISDDDLHRIVSNNKVATKRSTWIGDSTPYETGGLISDQLRVPVLEFEYKATDRHVYQVTENEDGYPLVSRAPFDRQHDNRYKHDIEVEDLDKWYKGSWVIGDSNVFDFGPVEHQKVTADESCSSFTAYAPEMTEFETWSITDSLISVVDRIQFAWIKLQNAINKARPKGILIELSSLESIDLGTGEELSPMGVMELYEQTGNLVYRRQTLSGEYSNGKPIEELQNGIGQEAQEWFTVIQNYFQFIRDLVGINEMTDGSTPSPRMGKRVAEMAGAASSNAIHFLLRAEKSIYERLAMSVAIRTEDALFLGFDHYNESLGAEHIKSVNEYNEMIPRTYGYKIYEKPTAEEEAMLQNDLMEAMRAGDITIADKVIIENIGNLKQAQQRLVYAVAENKKAKQQEAERNIRIQSEEIQKQTQIAGEMKVADRQAEGDAKVRIEQERGNQNRLTLADKFRYDNMLNDKKIEKGEGGGTYTGRSNSSNESSNKVKK